MLLASGAQVTAWDSREEPRKALEGRCELADPPAIDLAGFAGVVVSPGVPLNTHPIAAHAAAAGVPVIGDIELFAHGPARSSRAPGGRDHRDQRQVDHHRAGPPPAEKRGAAGADGRQHRPASAGAGCRLPAGGVYVLELSSYQIDLTRSLDCDVAALLNITPDHLDRYDGFEGYAASKARLLRDAERGPSCSVRDRRSRDPGDCRARTRRGICRARCTKSTGRTCGAAARLADSLQGPHNLQNAAVAVAIATALGLTPAQWRPALATFRGLPHRMERVAEAGGVLFINDSKATNPASTAPALAAFPPRSRPA